MKLTNDDDRLDFVASSAIQFKLDLAQAITKQVKRNKADGIIRMSLGNLRAITPAPTNGGPRGTNAYYHYVQIFNEVAASLPPSIKRGIYNS